MGHRQRKDLAAIRRRVEDEGDEEGVLEIEDLDDDSMTEGSVSDDEDVHSGDEVSTLGGPAPNKSAEAPKVNGNVNCQRQAKEAKPKPPNGVSDGPKKALKNGMNDMDMMLNGLKISDHSEDVEGVHYEDLGEPEEILEPSPAIVKSTAQMDQLQEAPHERRRKEHEEYKKKRDADPAFVPNRGAFFMHDHRHSGPAANGFRPFGRGRGRGRSGISGPYAPSNQMSQSYEPVDAQWTHDMHEVISEPSPRHFQAPAYAHANGHSNPPSRVPISAPKTAPPNRALSVTKHIGNVQIRIFLHIMEKPIVFPGIPVKQYTRLPDHRPPLRRDKPVRISLPDHPPRYIFPAVDRSFIFIPRAMRPNQQGFGGRGRGKPVLGSVGGYSRRTSIFGGSAYGSNYTPSVAMSRRSSLAREIMVESDMSHQQINMDGPRPVVKLPPQSLPPQIYQGNQYLLQNGFQGYTALDELPQSQIYPLPQKPTFRENRPNVIPMHQPRPQKAVSVADIESPATLSFNPPQQQQQPFHQQVPVQVNGNPYQQEALHHSRNPSYPSHASTGTPLSQIPERAIHAQPFQPHLFQQQQQQQQQQPAHGFYQQPYQTMQAPQGYYFPQPFNSAGTGGGAPSFIPQQLLQQPTFPHSNVSNDNAAGISNLIAQEVNGMVYYYDAAQVPAVLTTFPTYQAPPSYPLQQIGGIMGMGGMMTPSPDGFYYPQAAQQAIYYAQ